MLDNQQGSTTIGRLKVIVSNRYTIEGTTLTAFALLPSELATAIGEHTDLTSITVTSGTIDDTDRSAIYNLANQLTAFDLAAANYTGKDDWVYFNTFTRLQTAKLPKGITTLEAAAFHNCTSLKTVTLPEGLEIIGINAFYNCSSLKTVTLPEGLTNIKTSAFYNCTSLKTVTMPEGLTNIKTNAFYGCSSLKTVTCLATTPPTLGAGVFAGSNALTTIYVPAGSVDTYKGASGWSDYAGKIQAIH